MQENIEYKYFTAIEIKDWLYHNSMNGLSEKIIAKVRALSLIHHPDVTDNTVILSVVFVNNKVAGYTGMFPEKMDKPKLDKIHYWGTTLYVDPEFIGRGLGYCLMMHLKEACDYMCLGLDSAPESTYIDSKQGSIIEYYDRYLFRFRRNIHIRNYRTLLNQILEIKRKTVKYIRLGIIQRRIKNEKYSLEYINFIDDELYGFIKFHSSNDLFLRTQETLNWLLRYPFIVSTPLSHRTHIEYAFTSTRRSCQNFAVKVLYEGKLIGFYIIQRREPDLSVLYLYFDEDYQDKVFYSIVEHLIKFKTKDLRTFNRYLKKFLNNNRFYLWKTIEKVSFTFPSSFPIDLNLQIQGADGDMLI